ncbi:enoyl-CoA hydratase/isomerase family protein [Bradyrhizobium sp. NP1]|uniref:enoyl-CoA hydratase/isomerase family protein n=1 Tax=Bradyrhizobium sp. NP1 TaxID=3049772 RepID=UPI0025A50566|nr:enoyl-CoA hydratase/isomerase family protein [Bradyrhizobium sp. NP1]WJR80901.1 enoyl-CoA hydratase/isomerase family protein [Bradyrhizobium sp. NP1]
MKDTANRDMPSGEGPIRVTRQGAVATITLDRPRQRNPLNPELLQHLTGALDELERDAGIRAVILTGAGTVFCAGAELGTIIHPDGLDGEFQFQLLRDCFKLAQRIREIDLPVIAAVNGIAVGGGAALALACDFAIAAPTARYHFAFGRVGAAGCDMGCAYLLPKIVGTLRAKQWLLTGAAIDAEEGKAAGLFVEVCPADRLLSRAQELAAQIEANGPRRAVAATKFSVARGEEADFQTCISYEAYVQSFMFTLDDHRIRLRGYLEQRKTKPA